MPFDGSLAMAILYHLNVIVGMLKNDEVIPLNFLTDIFSGGVLNHNSTFLDDDEAGVCSPRGPTSSRAGVR